ncbi:hypothetical protein LUZ60_000679 [Juncus effusus]|nr:hypothetical protein LUZ60_000679 [Juncus effusus]
MEEEKPRQDTNPFIPHEEEEEEEEASKQESPERISAVDSSAMINRKEEQEEEDSDDNSGSEFEFPSLIRDPLIPFRNPIYPVFGRPFNSSSSSSASSDSPLRLPLRKLLIQERNSSVGSTSTSSSTAEVADLDGVPPESYCVWSPGSAPTSPASCRKSGSTGSLTKWKKISDLVLGRSHSDGKEKFVFFSVKEKEKGKGKKGRGKATTEVDTVTAHRIFYGGSGAGNGVAGGRKSFLPYRQDLVGLFASVNGISRTHHPF